MKKEFFALIMAGGQGSRFWPWSTEEKPKQFLNIVGNESLILQTYKRLQRFILSENIFIVADRKYLGLVLESIPGFAEGNFIEEPCPRNTAPCLILSNLVLSAINSQGNVLVVPADHYIPDEEIFARQMISALEFATYGKIITSGIKPNLPHTGYGYINFNQTAVLSNRTRFHKVKQFKEKPNIDKAKEYVEQGNYYWNSGMFIYSLAHFKDALSRYAQYYFDQYQELEAAFSDKERFKRVFSEIEPLSIDYALMEKAQDVVMFEAEFRWSDVGSWSSMYELNKKSPEQNVALQDNHIFMETSDSLIFSDSKKPIVAIGLEKIVVINTENGILISHFDHLQRVKEVMKALQNVKA